MPQEMVKLRQLRTLIGFKISDNSSDGGMWCTLEDVKHFKELRVLTLDNLERTSGVAEARAAALADKTHLTQIGLKCSEHEETSDKEVYEELCPPFCVEELYINNYFGRTFPSWLMRPSSLMNLRILTLNRCPHCEELPPLLWQLPQLVKLNVYRLNLRQLGLEFFLPNSDDGFYRPFPKLEKLSFVDLENWEEWEDWAEEKEERMLQKKIVLFPRLKELEISWCMKLRYLPHLLLNRATALGTLRIHGADTLEAVDTLEHIKTLKIYGCANLKRVAHLSSVKILDIERCENLVDMEHLPQLQLLYLRDRKINSLPIQGHFPKLNKLTIVSSNFRFLFRCRMDGEEWPKIKRIPHFEARSYYGLFIKYTKSPFSYDTNISSLETKNEGLPEQVNNISLHPHPLTLLPSINYDCRRCSRDGKGWFFGCEDCEDCRYSFHPSCAIPVLGVDGNDASSDIQEQQES